MGTCHSQSQPQQLMRALGPPWYIHTTDHSDMHFAARWQIRSAAVADGRAIRCCCKVIWTKTDYMKEKPTVETRQDECRIHLPRVYAQARHSKPLQTTWYQIKQKQDECRIHLPRVYAQARHSKPLQTTWYQIKQKQDECRIHLPWVYA